MHAPVTKPFGTLLVANRGEIALRVIRTARALGLRTVAVYSDADRTAAHVLAADTAVRIGPTPATESYLHIPALLEAARVSGAEAVHPGYGFLSERAAFADAVAEAGLVLVGPSAAVMEQMGRKDRARDIAVAAGVPVVPSYDPAKPEEMAFPVLVKAAAGGGGKGMRVVERPEEYPAALASAAREAASSFGDDTMLVERYVPRGRHIEVQVLADTLGNVVHLYERDCSTQRRHQKVLEEAPAPTLPAATRELVTSASVALAAEVGYTNAGTVEFLFDPDSGEVYFLEMNTRLQVEHPVTEAVVRVNGAPIDLVALQLQVAMGEPLPFDQAAVGVEGHAIEARVYAEDAFGGFLPQAGTAELVHWSPRARNDVALASGQEVSSAYDPMIGKIITAGPDREAARRLLLDALDETVVLGLTTNLGFLRALVAGEEFRDATIDTAWLDRNPDAVQPAGRDDAEIFAVWAIADHELGERPGDPFGTADGWRLSGPSAPATVELVEAGATVRWRVTWKRLTGPRGEVAVRLVERGPDLLTLEVDGRLLRAAVRVDHRRVEVLHRGTTFRFGRPDPASPGGATVTDAEVVAPMPGTVLAVEVQAGDQVAEGAPLGTMEAMKMELTLTAPYAGTVSAVHAGIGDQVPLGAVLFVVDPVEAAAGEAS
ncbi:MAG: biotin carboxylase N-terminal domain-containing protein [Marmoricola sp.]